MVVCTVQQFHLIEDDFYQAGRPQTIELTTAEFTRLGDEFSEPILLERLDGFFSLFDPEIDRQSDDGGGSSRH